ncbi:acid protease [Trametes coccinea BRFM310]|uniref:Acid protease n=1 Tax=Trametes coccinea (strain BRFM310) TaxID=1353009 RepID=A0A1Y2IDW1_TRAC3|nr:acid protease [Trametes coccinea BRFM310]
MRGLAGLAVLSFASVFVSAGTAGPGGRRAPSSSSSFPYPVTVSRGNQDEGFNFTSLAEQIYSATILVNGVPYQVELDTGSSDTWIDPISLGVELPPDLIYTGFNSTTHYVDKTSASGPIVLANVSIGPYTVYNQAITLSYNGTKGVPINGLIGLAGYSAESIGYESSVVHYTLTNTPYSENGIPIVYNIFEHEPDLPNYTTLLMERGDGVIASGGVFTISEVLSNMTNILNAARLTTVKPDQWLTFVDGIYVNGNFMHGGSLFENQTVLDAYRGTAMETIIKDMHMPAGSTLADFDTGTSLIYSPPSYVHAIYKDIPGAQLMPMDETGLVQYMVPCTTKMNITFSINGVLYPIHPIDAISVNAQDDGIWCQGSLIGGTTADTDWLLGDSFLRNVYILFGYGDPEGDLAAKQPYTQLLSRTNPDEAWLEFEYLLLKQALAFAESSGNVSSPVYTGLRPSVSLTEILPSPTADSRGSGSGTPAVNGSDDLAVAGAAAETGSAASNNVDLSSLTRTSYIIVGLLAAALVMLLVTLALVVKASRANAGYRALSTGNLARGKSFVGERDLAYETPYDS